MRPREGDTLAAFHARLMLHRDMGSFMAAQVIADLKYAGSGSPMEQAADWATWAAPGPGSLRGLNRMLGRAPDAPWKVEDWKTQFDLLQSVMRPLILARGMRFITGQDLQNCLCEFDKYERVRLGEGRPRSRYSPSKES
jgi:hypothetical protein